MNNIQKKAGLSFICIQKPLYLSKKIEMKSYAKLNEFDILDLLNEYQSEMRKLKHKLGFVKDRITELEEAFEAIKKRKEKQNAQLFASGADENLDSDEDDELPEEMAMDGLEEDSKSPAPAKAVAKPVKVVKQAKKPRKKKQKPGRKPQPLSLWDQMIVDSVLEKGMPVISRDILASITEKAIAKNVYEGEEKTKVKLNQCLVKLTASNRKALYKVAYEGRGHAYAMPKWVNKQGELLENYKAPSKE